MPRTCVGAEPHHAVEGEQALVAALDPVGLPAPVMGGEHHRPDDRVETRGVSAAGREARFAFTWSSEDPHHLTRLGVPPRGLFGEDHLAVHRHVEHSARRRDQPDVGIRERLLQLGRQTGGPRLVVSDDAVGDGGDHAAFLPVVGSARIVVRPGRDAKGLGAV